MDLVNEGHGLGVYTSFSSIFHAFYDTLSRVSCLVIRSFSGEARLFCLLPCYTYQLRLGV